MDQLERALRATLTDQRLDIDPGPGAVAAVHSGVRRRRRARNVGSVLAAAALVGGGVVTAATFTGSDRSVIEPSPAADGPPSPTKATKPPMPPPATEEVPWAAVGYDFTKPPAFPGAVADPSVPWCTAAQLSMTAQFQGATGNWMGGIVVTNGSASTCALQGQPAVHMVDAAGTTLVSSTPEPFYVDQWVRLAPSARAAAAIDWLQEFCNEPAPRMLAADLPHNGGTLQTPMVGAPRCNTSSDPPTAGRLDVDGFLTAAGQDPFTPEAGLGADITGFTHGLAAGNDVVYTVQLQSMHSPAVSLQPCLPFRERLVDQATGRVAVEEDHLLNCAAAPSQITDPSANHTVLFDLRLSVPANLRPGDYELLWQSVLKNVSATADDVVHVSSGPPPCTDDQLTASAGFYGQAMNQFGQVVVFTNDSPSACSLRGYPGLQLLDATGQPFPASVRHEGGYVFPDPPWASVTLTPHGGTASFTFGGLASDMNHGGGPCPSTSGVRVIAPGDRRQLLVRLAVAFCPPGDVSVAKVVAGSRGSRS